VHSSTCPAFLPAYLVPWSGKFADAKVCQLSANEHARRLLRVYMMTDAADVCQRQRVNYYQVRCRPSVSGKDKPHIENTLRKAKDIG